MKRIKMSLDQLPTVNWPRESGEYKVIQLYIDSKPYLRFGEVWGLHARILMNLLRDNNILYKTMGREYDDGYFEVPALRGDRYQVCGAGKAKIDLENKSASFGERSVGYRIGIDKKHLDSIKILQPKWKIELK